MRHILSILARELSHWPDWGPAPTGRQERSSDL